jgi:predicted MPP superfamily phosphohydrolase
LKGERVSRLVGLEDRSAREQLARSFPRVGIQPLPDPYRPGRVAPADVGITDPGDPLSFFVLGDVGGVKAAGPQNAVSVAMEQRQDEAAFALILGDVVYFNGEEASYHDQFYESYAKLLRPIVAFPGNHDGDPLPGDTSLAGFMTNFCDAQPSVPAADPQLEYGRHTQTLPYCEWTLALQAVTIVAVYSNVPSGGHLEPEQLDRLAQELKDADPAKPLIVALHHPPYSIDAHHGGSQHMIDALDQAFSDSGRVPDLVLSGHVHDYQRFTRTIGEKQVPYVVSGNGGYHNLHQLAGDAAPGEELADGVVFEYGDASRYGFLKLTVAGGTISGEYVGAKPGTMPDGSDAQITPRLDDF